MTDPTNPTVERIQAALSDLKVKRRALLAKTEIRYGFRAFPTSMLEEHNGCLAIVAAPFAVTIDSVDGPAAVLVSVGGDRVRMLPWSVTACTRCVSRDALNQAKAIAATTAERMRSAGHWGEVNVAVWCQQSLSLYNRLMAVHHAECDKAIAAATA